ncbi:insulinase family protein [Marinimicrobium sp. LS-A18]|uniref:insulinase family protein n=1 Tax=Marinimicrobium sp. LS-A18 TaxID=1381596 RepID=UPI0004653652|nr:insulinase family protein [Marinimicrobium sp. LS-A18]
MARFTSYHPILPSISVVLFGLIALIGISSCSSTPPAPESLSVIKSKQDPRQYRYLELDNGLKVMLIQAQESELSAAALAIPAGMYQDPAEFQGLAHYLEHMLFLGTEKYPEANALQTYLSENSGGSNAHVTTDHTAYYFQIPDDYLDGALDRFSDYFRAPLFDREYSEKERHAINNEWSMGKSQDPRILHRLRGLTGNPEHPLNQLGVGNLETLPGGDSGLYEAMVDFFERYYGPSVMTLTLIGKQNLDEQEALVRKHFSDLPRRDAERPKVAVPGITDTERGQHIYYRPQTELRQLHLEFGIENNVDQWRSKANHYVANILSSEEPGTLSHFLKDQGWANDVGVDVQPDFLGGDGLLRLTISTTKSGMDNRDQVIGAALAYIEQVRREGVTEAYYNEYKRQADHRFASQQPPAPLRHAIHSSIRMQTFSPQYINALDAEFGPYNPDAIQAVLDQLNPEAVRVWHISQGESVDTDIPHMSGQYAVRPITENQLKTWQQHGETLALNLPPLVQWADASEDEVEHDIQAFTQLVDEPALDVWFRHATHHQNGQGYLHYVWNTDLGVTDARHFVLGCLLNGLLIHQNSHVASRAGREGIHVAFDRSDSNMQNLTIHGPVKGHPELVAELMENFSTMEFNKDQLDQQRDNLARWLRSEAKNAPGQQTMRWLGRTMQAFDWDIDAFLTENESITVEDVRAYYQQVKETSTLRLYAFGHYLPEQVEAMARQSEAALGPDRRPGPIHVTETINFGQEDAFDIHRDVDHTDVAWLRAWIPGVPEDKRTTASASLKLLGILSHQPFFIQLRTEEQWGYWVQTGDTWAQNYPAFIALVQSSERSLPDIENRVERFMREFDETLQAVKPAEFEQMKSGLLQQFRQPPNDFISEASRYRHDFYRNDGNFNTHLEMADLIESTSLEKVQEDYRRWILGDGSGWITLQAQGATP